MHTNRLADCGQIPVANRPEDVLAGRKQEKEAASAVGPNRGQRRAHRKDADAADRLARLVPDHTLNTGPYQRDRSTEAFGDSHRCLRQSPGADVDERQDDNERREMTRHTPSRNIVVTTIDDGGGDSP
jgi:hypothetical protein